MVVTLSGQSQEPTSARQLQGKQLGGAGGCHCVLEPSHLWLLWHWCDTHVAPSDPWTGWGALASLTDVTLTWHIHVALSLSQTVTPGQAEVDHGTGAAFCPWVFATGTRSFEVVWFNLVVPQGSGLPNKCWRLKQALNYQLLLNFGTSAITSSRQRKLW